MRFLLITLFSLSSLTILAQETEFISYYIKCQTPSARTKVVIGIHDEERVGIEYVKFSVDEAVVETGLTELSSITIKNAPEGYPGGTLSQEYLNLSSGILMFDFSLGDFVEDKLFIFESQQNSFNEKSKTFKAKIIGFSPKSLKYYADYDTLKCKIESAY